VRLQSEHWTPLLEWAKRTFNVEINVSNSILGGGQPKETHKELGKVLGSLNHWELAGTSLRPLVTMMDLVSISAIERATYASKSLIIALALVKKYLTVEQAAHAACVEVNSQIERWGEVEDSMCHYLLPSRANMFCKLMM
jgi:ATP synthase F1 complex assembly factor 2